MSYQYCIVEWLWNQDSIRVNLPGQSEKMIGGSYAEVVTTLSQLGSDGWEVVSCAGVSNWLLWTLKRSE